MCEQETRGSGNAAFPSEDSVTVIGSSQRVWLSFQSRTFRLRPTGKRAETKCTVSLLLKVFIGAVLLGSVEGKVDG